MSSEHEPDDRELEEFLEGRGPLSQAYREASRESAPPQADAPILAAAKAAAREPAPRTARRPTWLRPLAFAATFVLSLSVLLSVWREPALRKQVVPGEEIGGAHPAAIEAEVQSQTAPASEPERGGANEVSDRADAARGADSELAKEKREAKQAETLRDALQEQEESRFKFYRQLEKGEGIGPADDRAASVAAPSQPRSEAPKAANAPMPAPPKPEPPAIGATGGFAPEPPPAAAAAAPPPSPVELDAPSSPPSLPTPESTAPSSRGAYSAIEAPRAPAPDTAAQKKSSPMLQSSSPVREDASEDLRPALDRDELKSVDDWLTRIRALRDRGDLDGARRELEALRKAYPAFEVPAELKRLELESR